MSSDILVPPVLTLPRRPRRPARRPRPRDRPDRRRPVRGAARPRRPVAGLARRVRRGRPAGHERDAARDRPHRVADDVLLVLLASHGDPAVVTANLAGPLVVAPDGTTRQLVLEDPSFELRARVGRLAPAPIERG